MSGWTSDRWAQAPEPLPKRPRRRPRWLVSLAASVALTLAVCATAIVVFHSTRGDASDVHPCLGPEITVSVAPDASDTVAAILRKAGCRQIKVVRANATDVLPSIVTSTDQPDIWIPDSSLWLQRAVPAAVRPSTLYASMATSPVVLVSGDGVPRKSYAEVIKEQDFLIGDPQVSLSAVSTVAVGSWRVTPTLLPKAITGDEMTELTDSGRLAELRNDGFGSTAVSEQQWVTFAPMLVAQAPVEKTAVLDFPVLLTASDDRRATIASSIASFIDAITSTTGQRALTAAGFRTDKGGEPKPTVGKVNAAGNGVEAAAADDWDRQVQPTRAIAAVDVSDSMAADLGGGTTHLSYAEKAVRSAISGLPANAEVGLWAFSDAAKGKLEDAYEEEVPMRRLDYLLLPDTQRDIISREAGRLGRVAGGDRALYDATIAAYKAVLDSYDPMASSSVIVMTDGSNDAGRITDLAEAVRQLKRLKDSRRPLPILAVGIGPNADMDALEQLARATGGAAYAAPDSSTASRVLKQAMSDRRRTMQ